MSTRDIDAVANRYYDDHRLRSVEARQYWRDVHANEDMSVALRRIRDLEAENERLTRQVAELTRYSEPEEYDPPTECQCHNRRNPPCSFCCP